MKWINVEDSLPPLGELVLTWDGNFIEKRFRTEGNPFFGHRKSDWYWCCYEWMEHFGITHWMPLPAPPA